LAARAAARAPGPVRVEVLGKPRGRALDGVLRKPPGRALAEVLGRPRALALAEAPLRVPAGLGAVLVSVVPGAALTGSS
jgi:hypothetical protein